MSEEQFASNHVATANGNDVSNGINEMEIINAQLKDKVGEESSLPMTSSDNSDIMSALQWRDGVGILPGTDMKFRLNETGEIEMLFDEKIKENDIVSKIQPIESDLKKSNRNKSEVEPTSTLENGLHLQTYFEKPHSSKFNNNIADSTKVEDQGKRSELSTSETMLVDDNNQLEPIVKEIMATCDFCSKVGPARTFHGRFCSKQCVGRHASKRRSESFRPRGFHNVRKFGRKRKYKNFGKRPLNYSNSNANDKNLPGTSLASKSNLREKFTWEAYLASENAKSVPVEVFAAQTASQPFPTVKNSFKEKFLLEAVDPQNQSIIALVSVTAVRDYRILLHFEGYPPAYDFWVYVDSSFIFPCGFCSKTGRSLAPPHGYTNENFDVNSYASKFNFTIAPKTAFFQTCFENKTGFDLNDRLEAVDRQNVTLMCVATVVDVIGYHVRVHFDGWDAAFDYWCLYSSNYIRPVGWCSENNKSLSPPCNYSDEKKFSWDSYLETNNYKKADPSRFSIKPHGFEIGAKLEVVDPRNPPLVRVATIADTGDYQVKIHFDGWDNIYDAWMDADSRDLHPVSWCSKVQEKLFFPLKFVGDEESESSCPISSCFGHGHIRSDRFNSHYSAFGCPYSPQNIKREPLQDRLSLEEIWSGEKEASFERTGPTRSTLGRRRGRRRSFFQSIPNRRKSSADKERQQISSVPEYISQNSYLSRRRQQLPKINSCNFEAAYINLTSDLRQWEDYSQSWEKHVLGLPGVQGKTALEVSRWSVDDVSAFVNHLTGKSDCGDIFVDQEIDGEAFLMLTQSDISSVLKLKLGPSVKIFNAISVIKRTGAA